MNTPTQSELTISLQAFSKQSHQFWSLQILGWLGYTMVVFISIIHPQFDDNDFNLRGQLLNLSVEVICGFILSFLQWSIIRRIVHWPLKRTLIASFASAAVLGLVFNVIKLASYKTIVYHQVWYQELDMLEFGGWFLFSVSTMFVWTAIFFIMLYNARLQKEHEMLLRAQTAAKDAQLQMLRYQLNPHFMFNTMNAISTLIMKKENDMAQEMLDKLCDFFRASLEHDASDASYLGKELELLDLYLSIEKVRFCERLNVNYDVDPYSKQARLPPLILQPIVENAIKYGVEARKKQNVIDISVTKHEAQLEILVENEGGESDKPYEKGFGIGLSNTKERLDTFFNTPCQLSVENVSTKTRVTMVIPFVIEK
ncbi:histidine kinase [Pseudoalteromonas luteoviolacea]|uniref:sensor histidine kinase n=1 Tax=Pseudoalteromonas luteoviolacea TaxID=43657 RepID=UPI001B38A490|nr:histidine kinase [Pseudoalteromonas luteoviolacea]MBQ4809758.1 histidine kinase [Pseudoalteromonas luteoviolacea]